MKQTLYIILFIILFGDLYTQVPTPCNTWPKSSCARRSINFTETSGKGAHYIDVEKNNSALLSQDFEKFTFEAWIEPKKQNNLQFVAGVWGPGTDQNDVWVIYINENDELVFEINAETGYNNSVDNTIAKTNIAALYNSWIHLACTFDGATQTIRIFLNQEEVASGRNATYPVNRFRSPSNPELPIKIGSSSAISNESSYRTFLGRMDQIRIWDRPLDRDDLLCNRDNYVSASAQGLLLFFKANELEFESKLCDFTGNGHIGELRSGTVSLPGTRALANPFKILSQPSFPDTIKCDQKKIYSFTVMDTSDCPTPTRARMYVYYRTKDNKWDWRDKSVNVLTFEQEMPKNVPVTFQVEIDADFVGQERYLFRIQKNNGCTQYIVNSNQLITRITDLKYVEKDNKTTVDTLGMGLLLAGCTDTPYREHTFQICNNSKVSGNNNPVTLTDFNFKQPDIFEVISPSTPFTLPVDGCVDVTVRFNTIDSAYLFYDTLSIFSTDMCEEFREIPIVGEVKEILGIFENDGETKLGNLDFGTVCVGFVSRPVNFYWENLSANDINIIDIIVPPNFDMTRFNPPVTLEPETSYRRNYIRFVPKLQGIFNDSIVIVVDAQGCIIRKKIYVSGKGYDPDVRFKVDTVRFPSTFVGQQVIINVEVENISDEALNLSYYLKQGDNFFLDGGKRISLGPNQTKSLPLTFRPLSDSTYYDEICFFENRCYKADCIPVIGNGVKVTYDYIPEELRMESVVACKSRMDTIEIKNISGASVNLRDFILDDPSGRFTPIKPTLMQLSTLDIDLDNNDSAKFIFEYTPNDVTVDRADVAYLRYKTFGEDYAFKLSATSALPKLYLDDITLFGTLEVGDFKVRKLVLENISQLDITIDSLQLVDVDGGYNLLYPKGELNRVLDVGDTIEVFVEFRPTQPQPYDATIYVRTSEPCELPQFSSEFADLNGFGKILPLDVTTLLIANGYVRPCDCKEYKFPLVNRSFISNLTIDSIWVDEFFKQDTINPANPEFYSWRSSFSPDGVTPYEIPSRARDTMQIIYCPRAAAIRDSLSHLAAFNLEASGPGWNTLNEIYLSGIQMLLFESEPTYLGFQSAYVDTLSEPLNVKVKIPDNLVNPNQGKLKVDSITFIPDERVFTASSTFSNNFPMYVNTEDSLMIDVNFKPRAPRSYYAKMQIHFSEPCIAVDTTIEVFGAGFANPFDLKVDIDKDSLYSVLDTIEIPSCDTLFIPVYSTEEIPADIVDIKFKIEYDTLNFQYVGAESYYMTQSCFDYTPNISQNNSPWSGSDFLLKNFCYVDSVRPFVIAKFLPTGLTSGIELFKVDSISFDTEEVLLYEIIPRKDSIVAKINRASFSILNDMTFDSVKVLDCISKSFTILNDGELPISLGQIFDLNKDMIIEDIKPPFDTFFSPEETVDVWIKYCPSSIYTFDSTLFTKSVMPCDIIRSNLVSGFSYAPELFVASDIENNFHNTDTIVVVLGETITVPIYFEKSLEMEYNNIVYKIKDLDFDVNITYNPRAVKYLTTRSLMGDFKVEYQHGNILIKNNNIDDLQGGLIAEIDFLVTVSDSLFSDIYITNSNFTTDSLMFIDIKDVPQKGVFDSQGACNITIVNFSSNIADLGNAYPNPWTNKTEIEFSTIEKAPISFKIYNIEGKEIYSAFDGVKDVKPGKFKIELNSNNFEPGVYYYILKTGIYTSTKKMVLIK